MYPVSEINDSEMIADSMPPSEPDNSEKSAEIEKPFRSDSPCDQAIWTAYYHPKIKGSLYGPAEDIPLSIRHLRRMNPAEYWHYQNKCIESQGFDVSGCTGLLPGGIVPLIHEGGPHYPDLESSRTLVEAILCSQFAVKTYNDKVTSEDSMKVGIDKRATLKFLEIARASWQLVSGSLYYITLWARETETGQEKLYRAKVWRKIMNQGMEVESFEEAPVSDQENLNLRRRSQDDPKELMEEEPVTYTNPHPFAWEIDCSSSMNMTSIRKAWRLTRSATRLRRAQRLIKKAGHPTRRSKRPFNVFVEEVRKSPELSKKDYNQIMSSAKSKWKMLSDKDKAAFYKDSSDPDSATEGECRMLGASCVALIK